MPVRNKPMGRIPVKVIDDLWKDSIDMHIHPGPDPNAERPIDSIKVSFTIKDADNWETIDSTDLISVTLPEKSTEPASEDQKTK